MHVEYCESGGDLKWKVWNVLDNGSVCLVDVMGTDQAIVQSARVSYGEGTKTPSDDKTLIRYLMRHRHTTPFEMCELKFRVKVPMDCWRQWVRHRTANINEYSTRYSTVINDKQKTMPSNWRSQSTDNKQGSGEYLSEEIGTMLSDTESKLHDHAERVYSHRISLGVAREQARKDIPLSTYTEAYWKIDLHNLLHFLELRMHPTAQYEIRQYAEVIGNQIVSKLFPITWDAFVDYRLNSVTLSATDIEILKKLNLTCDAFNASNISGNKREIAELLEKCKSLGVIK